MTSKLTLALGAVALVALGGWWATAPQSTSIPAFSGNLVAPANAAETAEVKDMVIGAEDAPVTIIEYASFTCPHCATFHENTFSKIKANYIDSGKVRFIYREVYFDRPGLWAGMVARCGGDMRYFGIVDMLFEKQRDWISGGEPAKIVASLRKIGLTSGLSNEALDACLADGDHAQALVANFEKNTKADDITATPSFVINGEKYSNMSYADFAKVIDEKLGS